MREIERQLLRCLGTLGENLKSRPIPPVLTYHSIDDSGSMVSVSPREFAWQMSYLKEKGFRSVSFRDYINALDGKTVLPAKAVVITFDDGFRNVHDVALPIMLRSGFTGTVFVPTAFIGKIPGWEMEEGLPRLPLMDWGELKALSRSGFEIQSHTHNHCRLSHLEASRIRTEIAESREAIECELGNRVDMLGYPYGENGDAAVSELKRAGFIGAATIEFGLNSPGADLFRLRRVGSAHFSERLAFRTCVWGMYGGLLAMRRTYKRLRAAL